jgi:glutamate-ammonia-ligase adenylyltransferase
MTELPAIERLRERAPQVAAALAAAPELAHSLASVIEPSEFVLDALARDPPLSQALIERAGERLGEAPLPWPALSSADALSPQADEVFMAALRRWRRAELTRIAWRDLAGWASLDGTLEDLSRAAERAVQRSYEFADSALGQRYGTPRSSSGEPQCLIVVAMGKLGGRELNFSSDIDLVLLYGEPGETDGPQRISNQEYFTRLAQLLVRLLAHRTEEGFAFRVDLRLRPYGDSGPTVCSAAAMEDYLQVAGRDWERYAWVKARAIVNEEAFGELYRELIQPFVYRRYLDFGVLESLREMKALIEREVRRRDLSDNIKLGDGGIREIEFIVQSFQLIRGGQDRHLQHGSLRRALPLLSGAKLLPSEAVSQLDAAYVFLRRLENRLQMRADQQVHRLPSESSERERLARSMSFGDWSALEREIEGHRALVASHFRSLVFGSGATDASTAAAIGLGAAPFGEALSKEEAEMLRARLQEIGIEPATVAVRLLDDFRQALWLRRLDEVASRRLTELLPVLIREAAATRDPLASLRRLLRVLEAIGARSAYFALLLHDGRARARLVRVAAHGDFLTDQIAAHPLLLDELIDARIFEHPPDRAALAADLTQRMAGVRAEDQELLVERLRQFQRAAFFRLAIADLLAALPVMKVSDRLTDLAELILEQTLQLAWQQLTPKLGVPMCGEGSDRRPVRIAVIGYGKLGGIELGYSSDLDLVLLHDSSGAGQDTAGERSIDNQVFFVRYAQRLLHLLTMHSAAGRLYEVDVRLRPSGKGGMLITSIDAFVEYQQQEAWTFEHQALLHARAVAGAEALRARFEQVRLEVLARYVRRERLREEVRDMRQRMRRERSQAREGQFDLKMDTGGIADIEFLAQYWALRWAAEYPPVVRYSDTIRQLESVASADLVPQATVDVLTRIYRHYRQYLHHRSLDGKGGVIAADELTNERSTIIEIWHEAMETVGPAMLPDRPRGSAPPL